jgi:hypothetical protein
MPKPSRLLLDRMERFRKLAIVLTAAEPRYLPNLDREFIQLSNVPDIADWADYRARFDPVRTQAWLSCPAEQIRKDAEFLLLMRAHWRDPVGGDWSQPAHAARARSDDPAEAQSYPASPRLRRFTVGSPRGCAASCR